MKEKLTIEEMESIINSLMATDPDEEEELLIYKLNRMIDQEKEGS